MSGWSAFWRRRAIAALLFASRSEVPGYLRQFRDLESAPPDAVREHQRLQLLDLLRHCHAHVPWYREQIERANLDLSERFTVDELGKLPPLTKETIRREGSRLHSDDGHNRGAFRNSTGGSTGEPITFLQDRTYTAKNVVAAKFIYNECLGKKAGELEFNLWGSERDILRGSVGAREKAINFVYNRRFQNFFMVDDEKLARFCDEVNRYKPVSMWAYAGSIELLARFIRREKRHIHSPKFIISTAGTLYPALRQIVQDVFRCPVYNQYGSREVGAIAFEMQDQDGLRGLPYLNYPEVVDGRVVVTCLTNYSMPLLRYEIGDTAEPWRGSQDANYGCRHKVFRAVTGRVHSHFKTATGVLVYGGFFAKQFYFLDWVAQFQIVQDDVNHITCHVVPADEPVERDVQSIRTRMRAAMGPACDIEFRFTQRIAPSPSGKHMHTVSKLPG